MAKHNSPWGALLRYIDSRDREFRGRIRGATPEDLDRLYGKIPHPMPTSILELFSSIGRDSGGYHPFGKPYVTDIDMLLEDLDEAYIADRFVRVAVAEDLQGLGDSDVYIDLKLSDGYDAPLLQVCEPWDGREPGPHCHSVMSKAISRAFREFDLYRRGVCGKLGNSVSADDLPQYVESLRSLTTRMQLQSVFCPRDDLQCYADEHVSLMFDGIGAGIPRGIVPGVKPLPSSVYASVWIGVADVNSFLNLVEQIREWMPPLPFSSRWLPEESRFESSE